MSSTNPSQAAEGFSSPQPERLPTIALAGVPNSGKTTLFNALTGMHYKVANYPGVTVEKREGICQIPELGEATLIDLPGTYSLFGSSPDEVLASKFLAGMLEGQAPPDVVVCVLDACNLERNLYLASQLLDAGAPLVLALTMTDVAKKQGIVVHKELLTRVLGVPAVDISGRKKGDLLPLKTEIGHVLGSPPKENKRYTWCRAEEFRNEAENLGKKYIASVDHHSAIRDVIGFGIGLLTGIRRGKTEELKQAVIRSRVELRKHNIDPSSYEAEKRYQWISQIVKRSVIYSEPKTKNITEAIDRILTHKLWGTLIFLMIMALMFNSIFAWATVPMEMIDRLFASLRNLILETLPANPLRSLLADGVVAGAGSVLVFIPQIAYLYFFISLLEESGYLARAAFLMDKLMRSFGLQGRSFIPLLSCFACAVPGIMATRSIPSLTDRMVTIMVAPLMSCSARLPVYTLLIAAFVPNTTLFGFFSLQGAVLLALYLLGIFMVTIVTFVFKRTLFRGEPTHFIMEMPPYRLPRFSHVLRAIWDRICLFIKAAGTVIMLCSIVLWFLASYPKAPSASPAESLKASYAGQIGQFIEPAIEPLGYNWKIGVSIVASFAAREVFVSSMALVHNLEGAEEPSDSLVRTIRGAKDPQTGKPSYSTITAISLMVFYAFACQCMSTLAVCRRETGSWKWPTIMFLYMTGLAYVAALLTYQIGSRLL